MGDDQINPPTEKKFTLLYASRIQKALPNHQINWHYECTPQATITEALTGRYDVVVTDLDFGEDGDKSHEEGYKIIDAVSKMNPRPLLILCTSNDETPEMSERINEKAMKSPIKGFHKWEGLADFLITHIKELKGGEKE